MDPGPDAERRERHDDDGEPQADRIGKQPHDHAAAGDAAVGHLDGAVADRDGNAARSLFIKTILRHFTPSVEHMSAGGGEESEEDDTFLSKTLFSSSFSLSARGGRPVFEAGA